MGDFYGHEDSRTIAVRRWMIDATRDDDGSANYAAALLLAQVTFWSAPSTRTGRPRATHEHGGETWLVRADGDPEWMAELGMAERAVRRARRRLEALGLIEARTLVDKGQRCTHLRRLPIVDGEPSTIRPKAAVANGQNVQTIRPETADHPPPLDVSHAGASPCSSREVGEMSPGDEAPEGEEPKAERDPQLLRAEAIVKAHWDWCHAQTPPVPTPTLRAVKGNRFLAVRNICRAMLDAGWGDDQVADALRHTRAFTIDGLTFTLRERHTRPTTGPRAAVPREAWGESGAVQL